MKVLIEPHNPAWVRAFEIIRDQIQEILAEISNISIEHVGSTSIPGLIAKPVLDIDIIVKQEHLTETRVRLVQAGYEDLGEMGVPSRYAFRQPGYDREEVVGNQLKGQVDGEREMRRNTYVVLEGCLSLRNHMDLKRTLLKDEKLRDEYSEVKCRLAKQDLESVDEYCRGKNDILLKILKTAGWNEHELEEVRKANE